jgi:ornithine carbamoyltransferase
MLSKVEANRRRDKPALADIERACLTRNAQFTDWICDERRMALTRGGHALYMHCLPADIGDEVTPSVMDRFKVEVAREANKKVYVVMALLAVAKNKNLAERLHALAR